MGLHVIRFVAARSPRPSRCGWRHPAERDVPRGLLQGTCLGGLFSQSLFFNLKLSAEPLLIPHCVQKTKGLLRGDGWSTVSRVAAMSLLDGFSFNRFVQALCVVLVHGNGTQQKEPFLWVLLPSSYRPRRGGWAESTVTCWFALDLYVRQKLRLCAYFSGFWPGPRDHWTMECHGDWVLRVWWSGRQMEEGFENPSKGELFA